MVVIEPVLDVWYFMLSTTMCCAKLLLAFWHMSVAKPGYLENDPSLNWVEVMTKIKSKYLCPHCKVIKTRSSYHCHLCNKCVDRYEGHCAWTDNCIGRKNNNSYFAFIFYVWLCVFLVGWTSYSTIPILECELVDRECVYHSLCFYCNEYYWHYFCTYFDALVCLFFFFPSSWLCCKQWINYGQGKTSHERFARQARSASATTSGTESERGDSFASLADLKEAVSEEARAQ